MSEHPLEQVAITPCDDGALLPLRVIPGAPFTGIDGVYGHRLKVRIKAPPEKGKANRELLRFLASCLNLKKMQLRIVAGEGTRDKLLSITGCPPSEIADRLAGALPHET